MKMALPPKIGVLTVSVLCAAAAVAVYRPAVTEFANSELPSIWRFLMTWLTPPYLYVVVNGIIITIVASSKLQKHKVVAVPVAYAEVPVPYAEVRSECAISYEESFEKAPESDVYGDAFPEAEEKAMSPQYGAYGNVLPEAEDKAMMSQYDVYYDVLSDEETKAMTSQYDVYYDVLPDEEAKAITSVVNPEAEDKMMMMMCTARFDASVVDQRIRGDEVAVSSSIRENSGEKPPVSVRIGHRKGVKPISEGGRALRVSKPKRQETLETTWKTITEGRPMPLTRHLRKSDTWETHGHRAPEDPDPKMTKSETFHDHTAGHRISSKASPSPGLGRLRKEPSGSWKLRKDPSLSQDDLNRRVEAFISKFNEDMRLQRQESLNQYMEMINRGAH